MQVYGLVCEHAQECLGLSVMSVQWGLLDPDCCLATEVTVHHAPQVNVKAVTEHGQ